MSVRVCARVFIHVCVKDVILVYEKEEIENKLIRREARSYLDEALMSHCSFARLITRSSR